MSLQTAELQKGLDDLLYLTTSDLDAAAITRKLREVVPQFKAFQEKCDTSDILPAHAQRATDTVRSFFALVGAAAKK